MFTGRGGIRAVRRPGSPPLGLGAEFGWLKERALYSVRDSVTVPWSVIQYRDFAFGLGQRPSLQWRKAKRCVLLLS